MLQVAIEENELKNYSSGESVYDNTRIEYKSLKLIERKEHLKELWRICFIKSFGAS